MVDTAIQWINLYAPDNAAGFPNTYSLDSNLLGYSTFEQLGPVKFLASKPGFQQKFSGANVLNKSMYYLNSYFQKLSGGDSNQKTLCWGSIYGY